nr:hypothetical protein [uncultured Carboxylicivirga sp.]
MNFNKLYIVFLLTLSALFVGCSEWEDTVESSPNFNDDSAVRFSIDNSTEIRVNPSNLSFTLTVNRDNPSSMLEVPIGVITNTDNIFTIPATVSFAAGEETTSFDVTVAETADFDVYYAIELEFGEEYFSNPYKKEYPTYSGQVMQIYFCPLNGLTDLVGTWSGDEQYWATSCITQISGSSLSISGLSEGMIEGWWGEPIIERGTVVMNVNLSDGTIAIPRQYIYTTEYSGDPYRYEIEGTGKWDNCGDSPTLLIEYDIYYEGDAVGLAATYGADYLGGISFFTASLTLE